YSRYQLRPASRYRPFWQQRTRVSLCYRLYPDRRCSRMQTRDAFFSLHRQGFVRVAACTPRICVGDPKSNAEETLALMHDGEGRQVDLMLFPELGLSAYAIDDLLLQDALLDGVEAA